MTIDFEKHLRETQRLTHIGSWEWDIASDTLTWSDEHYRIFGLAPEQCTPTFRDAIRYVHSHDVSRIEEAVARCVTDGVPFSCEYRVLRADGTERTVLARGARTDDARGGTPTLYGTVQDITERKQAEYALFLIERYLRVDQEISNAKGTPRHAALSPGSEPVVSLGANSGLTGSAAAIVLAATELSPQERRALDLVAQGKTNKEIAAAMKLSPKTVKNYLSSVFQKLKVAGRAEAVSRMLRGKPE
jgi:PAS domain S-box-containing protein